MSPSTTAGPGARGAGERTKVRALVFLVLSALILLLIACAGEETQSPTATRAPASAATAVSNLFRLTILHNNDGESQLLNLGPGLEDYGGVAQFTRVVERERALATADENDGVDSGVIVVSSGDNFLATPIFRANLDSGVFFDAQALDLIDYDAIALGNHEFDFGPEVLAEFIKQVSKSRAPFLSSNLDFSGEPVLRDLLDEGRIAESIVVEGAGVGIIGATTPNLGNLSSPRRVRVISDVVGEIQAEVDRLEASGVNRIVLLSHMQTLEEDLAMIRELHGVDVVVAGGGDDLLAGVCDPLIPGDEIARSYPLTATDQRGVNVPVVTTAGKYSYLGRLVVTFDGGGRLLNVDREASRPIRIALGDDPISVEAEIAACRLALIPTPTPIPIPTVTPTPTNPVEDLVATAEAELREAIAGTEVDLDARESEVRTEETNLGNLLADAVLWQTDRLAIDFGAPLPDVALVNGGAIRNDEIIAAGGITTHDTFAIAPFDNAVTVVEGISISQFKEILENVVSRAADRDPDQGTGRFAQVSGFSFEWSESGTAQVLNDDRSVSVPGTRVQRVVLDSGAVIVGGGRVVAGDLLAVATLDFVAGGGDEYPFRGAPFTALGVTYQRALSNFITSSDGLGGTVTAADYPEGGEGRITRLP